MGLRTALSFFERHIMFVQWSCSPSKNLGMGCALCFTGETLTWACSPLALCLARTSIPAIWSTAISQGDLFLFTDVFFGFWRLQNQPTHLCEMARGSIPSSDMFVNEFSSSTSTMLNHSTTRMDSTVPRGPYSAKTRADYVQPKKGAEEQMVGQHIALHPWNAWEMLGDAEGLPSNQPIKTFLGGIHVVRLSDHPKVIIFWCWETTTKPPWCFVLPFTAHQFCWSLLVIKTSNARQLSMIS